AARRKSLFGLRSLALDRLTVLKRRIFETSHSAATSILMRILRRVVWNVYLIRVRYCVLSHACLSNGRQIRKRTLIGSLSVLAMIAATQAANAQANINPNVYPGNTSGSYGAQAPWEWQAGAGPGWTGRAGGWSC